MSDFPPVQPMPLRDALTYVAERLTAAGVPTVIDPDRLHLPGAVVYPNTIDYDVLGAGVYELTVDLVMVAKGASAPVALDQLDKLLTAARTVWPVDVARAAGVKVRDSAASLPALTAQITVNVSPEQEL